MSVDRHAAALADRAGGSLVDAATIGVPGGAICAALPNAGGEACAVALAYITLPVAYFGKTLGKVLAGTRVVHARHGGRPSLAQAFERSALLVLPLLVLLVTLPFVAPLTNLYVFMLGVIAAGAYTSGLTREDLAVWHDVYANTMFVRS